DTAPTAREPALPVNDVPASPAVEQGTQAAAPTMAVGRVGVSYLQQRRRLHAALIQALDLRRPDITRMTDDGLREEARQLLTGLLQQEDIPPDDAAHARLLTDVSDEAIGLGPREPLLADGDITEIMVNR